LLDCSFVSKILYCLNGNECPEIYFMYPLVFLFIFLVYRVFTLQKGEPQPSAIELCHSGNEVYRYNSELRTLRWSRYGIYRWELHLLDR
jgi:hypothetical protein